MRPAKPLVSRSIRAGARALLALVAAVSLAACDTREDGDTDEEALSGDTYEVELTSEDIGPEPGDPDGEGEAVVRIDRDASQVCATVTVRKVDDIITVHLLAGTKDDLGPVVAELSRTAGPEEECKEVPPHVIDNIRRAPGDFFVNVRSREHPGGALRGQLPGKRSDAPGTPPAGVRPVTTTTVPGRPSTSTTG